ncbi:MAG: hypothetical protein HC859_17065 [Bacteroidia bacterium]|nr:hypothetical protein [Bacteroidia bacterium]
MTPDERLLSYLDGTLGHDEQARLEAELRNQPDLRRRFEELQEIDQMLKAVKPEKISEMFTTHVMGRLDHAPARVDARCGRGWRCSVAFWSLSQWPPCWYRRVYSMTSRRSTSRNWA